MSLKKIVSSFFLILAIFFNYYQAEVQADSSEQEKIAEKQGQLLEKFEKEMQKENVTYDDLNEVGSLYFEGETIVFQLKDESKDQVKLKKLQRISDKMQAMKTKQDLLPDDAEVKEVLISNSYNDLVKIQDEVYSYMENEASANHFSVKMRKSKLEVVTDSLTKEQERILKENYNGILKITVDPNYQADIQKEAYKSRFSDFNSLGAGIGIKTQVYNQYGQRVPAECSTAGVAHNNRGSYWLLSAGHCNNGNLTQFYQYDAPLGSTYQDYEGSKYDMLLINVTSSQIARRASNGLYSSSASTESGYDSSLTGDLQQYAGLEVCKVGITTNRTCGVVWEERVRHYPTGNISFYVMNDGQITSAPGDSGGAWFTRSLPQRLVGIHWAGGSRIELNGQTYSRASYVTPWREAAQFAGIYLYTSNSSTPIN